MGDSALDQKTKTGLVDAGVKVGVANRRWVIDHLQRLYLRAEPADQPLFRVTLAQYEKSFRLATAALQMTSLRITPHTLRHTGLTEDRLSGRLTLQEVQQRGQWSSHSSVVRYEKHTKILRQIAKMPRSQQLEGQRILKSLARVFKEEFPA